MGPNITFNTAANARDLGAGHAEDRRAALDTLLADVQRRLDDAQVDLSTDDLYSEHGLPR